MADVLHTDDVRKVLGVTGNDIVLPSDNVFSLGTSTKGLKRLFMAGGAGSYIVASVLTTAQRDALTGVEGMIIFNSTTDQLEEYDGSTWEAVGQVIMTTHEADIDAHMADIFQDMIVGGYYSQVTRSGASAVAANRLYYQPFFVPRSTTFDRLMIDVSSAGAGGTKARLGIYYMTAATMKPGALLVDGGEIAVDAIALPAATIDQQLTKGWWALVFVTDGTPSLELWSIANLRDTPEGVLSTSLQYWNAGGYVAHTYGALPATFGTATATNSSNSKPIVAARVASLD